MRSWIPCPRDIVAEIEMQDFSKERPACDAAGFLYVWKLKLDGVKLTERKIANRMGWSRHKSRQLLNRLDIFWIEWEENMCRPKYNQNPTMIQPKTSHKKRVPNPNTDDISTEDIPLFDQEPAPTRDKVIKKKVKQIKEFTRPLGEGLQESWMTKSVCEVWDFWFKYNPRTRKIRKDQVRVIKAALKAYSVEQCCNIIEYANEAPDSAPHVEFWREQNFMDLINLLNTKNIPRNEEHARAWKEGDMNLAPAKVPALPPEPKIKTTRRKF